MQIHTNTVTRIMKFRQFFKAYTRQIHKEKHDCVYNRKAHNTTIKHIARQKTRRHNSKTLVIFNNNIVQHQQRTIVVVVVYKTASCTVITVAKQHTNQAHT